MGNLNENEAVTKELDSILSNSVHLEKKERKKGSGRPKGSKNKSKNETTETLNNNDSNGFKPIDDYKNENEKNESETNISDSLDSVLTDSPENSNLVKIKLDKKNLVLAEIFIDSILQKILNAIGFNIEFEPMSDNDLEIWEKLAPEVELEKGWKNFFKFYLIAKAKN